MLQYSPLSIAGIIVALVALAGVIVDGIRKLRLRGRNVEPRPQRNDPWILKLALAIGVIATVAVVVTNEQRHGRMRDTHPSPWAEGVLPSDFRLISNIAQWRTISPEELDPAVADWAKGSAKTPLSRILFQAGDNGDWNGAAYLLANIKNPAKRRVVWIVDHQVVYDAVGSLAAIAKVPRDHIAGVQWTGDGNPEQAAESGGLLVILDPAVPAGSTLLFTHQGRVVSGVPTDFHSVAIQ